MKWFKKSVSSSVSKYFAMGDGKSKFEFSFCEEDTILVNKKKVKLKIVEGNNNLTYIIYNKKKFQVEIVEKNQNKYHVVVCGISYYFTIETPISYKRKRKLSKITTGSTSKSVIAPMPGKIIDIMVEEETVIKEGDSLFILEVMKMQNEILSEISGKIVKINVNKNDTVAKDTVLIELK